MLEKEFLPYQESLALKKLGFDEPCFATIDQTESIHIKGTEHTMGGAMFYFTIDAPTYSQAFKFFREKYPDLDFGIGKIYNGTNNYHYHINLNWEYFEGTYEESELACLKKLIEIVKINNEYRNNNTNIF